MIGRYQCQEYVIEVAGRTLRLLGPDEPDLLLNDPVVKERFDQDEYLPYWAQPWPSAVMLAEYLDRDLPPSPSPVLELGAGLGIVTVSLSLGGHRVVATDYDEDALLFVRKNAARNGVWAHDVRCLDWRDPPDESFGAIVGADILYEERNGHPIIDLHVKCLAPGGRAFVCDPNRNTARGFADAVRATGMTVGATAVGTTSVPAIGPHDGRPLNAIVYTITKGRSTQARS